MADIDTEYVLIDFWASWCAPCVAEIPYQLEAYDKHKDHLTVLAISLDMTEDDWRKGIEKHDSGVFTHGYIGYDSDQRDLFKERFGLMGIPASFLLDRGRRIIGTDFRHNRLKEELDRLGE